MIDWGIGRYETTAEALEPAALHIVELAAIAPGERVLDIGCGTGNAALAAAAAGGSVVGLDPAERLVGVARDRAEAAGLDATFVVGDAQSLPFPAGAFDAALSVFAVIFAPDPRRAVAEAVRVLTPSGRAFLTAWLPRGATDAMIGVLLRAAAEVSGGAPPRFPWHERGAVEEIAADAGASVAVHHGEVVFTGESPEAYFAMQDDHPMSIGLRPVLERTPDPDAVRAAAIAALREHNEDPAAFRATAPYVVYELRRR